jgi:hypothetical protein
MALSRVSTILHQLMLHTATSIPTVSPRSYCDVQRGNEIGKDSINAIQPGQQTNYIGTWVRIFLRKDRRQEGCSRLIVSALSRQWREGLHPEHAHRPERFRPGCTSPPWQKAVASAPIFESNLSLSRPPFPIFVPGDPAEPRESKRPGCAAALLDLASAGRTLSRSLRISRYRLHPSET